MKRRSRAAHALSGSPDQTICASVELASGILRKGIDRQLPTGSPLSRRSRHPQEVAQRASTRALQAGLPSSRHSHVISQLPTHSAPAAAGHRDVTGVFDPALTNDKNLRQDMTLKDTYLPSSALGKVTGNLRTANSRTSTKTMTVPHQLHLSRMSRHNRVLSAYQNEPWAIESMAERLTNSVESVAFTENNPAA